MRKINVLLVLFAFFSSCNFIGGQRVRGNGNSGSQTRNVGSFHAVHVLGSMDVILNTGPDYAVKVEADENLLPYILTERDGDALMIRTRNGYNLESHANIKVYVTAPAVDELVVTGSGTVTSSGQLKTGQLKIDVTGSGDVKLDVDVPEITSEATGSGNIILTGNTRNFSTEINGSGEVHCFNLLSENTKVEIAGSGDAEVYASKTLDVQVSGSGDVKYKGTPQINQHVTGSGSVRSAP